MEMEAIYGLQLSFQKEENPLMEANASLYRKSSPKQHRKSEQNATGEDGARLTKKAFIKVTNSRQRKPRQAHLDCSEHSNSCHMALRWGLAQEVCHGHGSAKSEITMSGGERGVSGRRVFASELFGKRR